MEHMAALVSFLDAYVAGGDRLQGPWQEQRRIIDDCSMNRETNRHSNPLLWNPALKWAEDVSVKTQRVSYYKSMQTLRWGQQVVDLQKMLFPTETTGLTAHKSAPKTCVIPLLFPRLSRDVDWKYTEPSMENGTRAEARRNRSIFTAAMTTLALEMVLASARRLTSETESTEPDILVCGCLWSFLGDLNEFHRHAIEDLCRTAHQVWRIGGTAHYDIAEWMHNERIVYRAGQHAHGLSAKVELCFFVRAHRNDPSWAGDQTLPQHIHQITSRARERLYVFVEDLSRGIELPPGEK